MFKVVGDNRKIAPNVVPSRFFFTWVFLPPSCARSPAPSRLITAARLGCVNDFFSSNFFPLLSAKTLPLRWTDDVYSYGREKRRSVRTAVFLSPFKQRNPGPLGGGK